MTQAKVFTFCMIVGLAGCAGASAGDDDPGNPNPGGPGGPTDPGGPGGSGDPGHPNPPPHVEPTYPTQHPRIYISAHKDRLQQSLSSGRAAATRFRTVVDGWLGGNMYWGAEAWHPALLGAVTGEPKYCTKAVAVVEAQVASAESAIASGGRPAVANDSYLDVGGMIGDVALVYDWCHANLSANQKARWLAYANQAVWNVWHPNQARWGNNTFTWSGWSVDNPSNNYYYSFLRATMLLGLAAKGEDPQADGWIDQFREVKVLGQLIPTFDEDLVGGGSREGTGYGVAMRGLWRLYDIWKSTTGEDLGALTDHTYSSMLSFIHQIVPTLDRFAPTGDQSRDSTASLFDYQRNYLQGLIALHRQTPLAGAAQALLAACSVPKMSQQFMAVDDYLYDNDVPATSLDGLGRTYYAPGIGELYTRSGWDKHATWVNLIAGPYTESHAHQDQGSLMIYKDGWLSYDAVVDSRSGLRQETNAHSLVRVDSGGAAVRQIASTHAQLVALHAGSGWVHAAADTTAAYNGNSAISKMQREIVVLEPDVVVVYDRVVTAPGTTQVWQLATPRAPSISGSTATISGAQTMTVRRLAPAGASSSSFSFTGDSSGDYNGGYRLDATISGGDRRFLHVLSIGGAATSATASGESTVTVALSNGKTATVAFNRDAVGATLTYGGAPVTLGAGVDQMPE
ncbi:MAG: hypothetical protein KF773_23360 [Deltaproteobacteria bacterium]|nr:hypothetical protein [Deltaproteobacteria bacterium]MCW5806982.1 hypothetical protein [Deltaproteobacteria bacterium]